MTNITFQSIQVSVGDTVFFFNKKNRPENRSGFFSLN